MATTAPTRWRRIPRAIATAPLVWLERARGRRRLALALLYALVATIPAAFVVREGVLRNLPDVGDPFDVAAYRAPRPDNALALYREAAETYRPPSDLGVAGQVHLLRYGVSVGITPASRRWIDDNAATLELWRRSAERPTPGSRDPSGERHSSQAGPPALADDLERIVFAWMAGVRARDCAESGDPAGAWAWHRARLRDSRRLSTRGGLSGFDAIAALNRYRAACAAAELWAEEPGVDAALLRRALADVREMDAVTPVSDMLKAEYVRAMALLDDPPPGLANSALARLVRSGDATEWYRYTPVFRHLAWFFRNEPKRSRRLVRQVYANWLARCDQRPRAPFQTRGRVELFDATPPVVGALPPGELARWLESPSMAGELLHPWIPPVDWYLDGERARRAQLVVSLAAQLYRRERGSLPKSPAELVGPYLKALPEGFDEKKDPRLDPATPAPVRSR
jgi:hypothetical protein